MLTSAPGIDGPVIRTIMIDHNVELIPCSHIKEDETVVAYTQDQVEVDSPDGKKYAYHGSLRTSFFKVAGSTVGRYILTIEWPQSRDDEGITEHPYTVKVGFYSVPHPSYGKDACVSKLAVLTLSALREDIRVQNAVNSKEKSSEAKHPSRVTVRTDIDEGIRTLVNRLCEAMYAHYFFQLL